MASADSARPGKETHVKLSEMTVDGFLAELGSDSPAPGGGSAAALAGAIAASLCEMVCRLTLGRETYKDAWAVMRGSPGPRGQSRIKAPGADRRRRAGIQFRDGGAKAAARRPRSRKQRAQRAIQEGTLRSARVPLETLEYSCAACGSRRLVRGEWETRAVVTDAGSAAQMIRAGAAAAAWNVRVNLPSIRDAKLKEELGSDAARLLEGISQNSRAG